MTSIPDTLTRAYAYMAGAIMPPNASVDAYTLDGFNAAWNFVQEGDNIGFAAGADGVTRLTVKQAGIYSLHFTYYAEVPQFGAYGYLSVTLPTSHPVLTVNTSGSDSYYLTPLSVTAYMPPGVVGLSVYHAVDFGQLSGRGRYAVNLSIDAFELVPAGGFTFAAGTPAPTAAPVLASRARNSGMRFA